jgi:hypothetical protein
MSLWQPIPRSPDPIPESAPVPPADLRSVLFDTGIESEWLPPARLATVVWADLYVDFESPTYKPPQNQGWLFGLSLGNTFGVMFGAM